MNVGSTDLKATCTSPNGASSVEAFSARDFSDAQDSEDDRPAPVLPGASEPVRPSMVVAASRSAAWAATVREPVEEKQHTSVLPDDCGKTRSEFSNNPRLTHKKSRIDIRIEAASSWVSIRIEQARRKTGLADALARVPGLVDAAKTRRSWQVVHGGYAQAVVSAMIMLHSMLVGYRANDELMEVVTEGHRREGWSDVAETVFTCLFTLELVLRLVAERECFLIGPFWRWNVFDSVLVVFSLVDSFTPSVMGGDASGGNGSSPMTMVRMIRLTRFSRVMRISRVIQKLSSLRIIFYSIMGSMLSLLWCAFVILLIEYVFAVLIVYGVADFLRVEGGAVDERLVAGLKENWGSIYISIVTLFKAISGGTDWENALRPLKEVDWIYEPVFVFYVFFMCLGVLNVVIGAFVCQTSQVAAQDKDTVANSELQRVRKYTRNIKKFFLEADVDKSGKLSWTEFKTHLSNPKVKAYFQALDLEVSQANHLFDLLDTDNDGLVSADEFVDGANRLKGYARNLDMNMLVVMCKEMHSELRQFMRQNQARMPRLSSSAAAARPAATAFADSAADMAAEIS